MEIHINGTQTCLLIIIINATASPGGRIKRYIQSVCLSIRLFDVSVRLSVRFGSLSMTAVY